MEILEDPNNDYILTQMLDLEIKQAKYNKSLAKLCEELGIDTI